MDNKIIIAIDGYSSSGKGTLAKDLAHHLKYKYVDTGAMYRAVTWHFLQNQVNPDNTAQVKERLHDIRIDFRYEDESNNQSTFLNGQNIEPYIRAMEVSEKVSAISQIPEVRAAMISIQREIGQDKGLVMDGRDIGSVVFPEAELKIFMKSEDEVRAKRRFDELKNKGEKVTFEQVKSNLLQRDYNDTHRSESPLIIAEDAYIIDNTKLNREEQLAKAIQLVNEKIKN